MQLFEVFRLRKDGLAQRPREETALGRFLYDENDLTHLVPRLFRHILAQAALGRHERQRKSSVLSH